MKSVYTGLKNNNCVTNILLIKRSEFNIANNLHLCVTLKNFKFMFKI